jgi:ElaB/YqjD/DUF883 family membrane-anchored ribosome-binding protein
MNAGEKRESKDMEQNAEAARADVNALAAQAMDAMRKAVDEMTELLRANAPGAVSALKEAGKAAGDNIGDLAHNASDMGRDRLDDLSAAVRRNPLSWLAAAAGLGLIFGLWNNRGGRP